MRIVYMGTPDFAVKPLEALIAAGHDIVLAVTQPDKKKGRGKEMQPTPVKECALRHGIEVFQPVKIKSEEAVQRLRACDAELFVVAAFGQILSQEILDMPHYGCVNIHASLLPKYRGAAPIQWAILNGERETGVTVMQMEAGLDTGDMLLKEVVLIDAKETGETLHDKLSEAGARLIVRAIPLIEGGKLTPQKQNDAESCYAKMLTKELGHIRWEKSAAEIERLVRGLNAWPSAYTYLEGKTLKIWEADVVPESDETYVRLAQAEPELIRQPAAVIEVTRSELLVVCGEGLLRILQLQLEGKRRMGTEEFLRGKALVKGIMLGE